MNNYKYLHTRHVYYMLALAFFIFPQSSFAFTYSSEPCPETVQDCPAGPIAGLPFATSKSHDNASSFDDNGSKKITCHYGTTASTSIRMSFHCLMSEEEAIREAKYSNHEEKRPPTGSEFSQQQQDAAWNSYRGPCNIPSPAGVDAQRCSRSTNAGRYFVDVLGTYPQEKGATDRKAAVQASEAGAMELVEAGVQAVTEFKPKEPTKNSTRVSGRAFLRGLLDTEEPIPFAQVELVLGGTSYTAVTDKDGKYSFEINEDETKTEGVITLTFMGELHDREYFEVVDSTLVSKDPVQLVRTVDVEKDTDMLVSLLMDDSYTSDTDTSKLLGIADRYNEFYEAIDYAERVLELNIGSVRGDDMLPITIYTYSSDAEEIGSSYYDPAYGSIYITADDSRYLSDGPFTVFHEFGHHIMYSQYSPTVWEESLEIDGNVSHGGILNTNTADSMGEGYATFLAILTAQEHGYAYPHVYEPSPVLFERNWEVNIQAWDMEGVFSREELAVATLLYDLYDKHKDTGDDIALGYEGMVELIKDDKLQTVKALYDKLLTVESKEAVDALFIAHGFFWDKQEGDGEWNFDTRAYTDPDNWKTCTTTASEPYQDTNKDNLFDATVDKWMDYSNFDEYPCTPTYDEGDVVGYTGSYQTNARESFADIPNRFIEVNNGIYTQAFTFPENPEYDYTLRYDVVDNRMPVTFPPARYNATVAITNAAADESQSVTLTTEEYTTLITETSENESFKVLRTEEKKNLFEEGDTQRESEGGAFMWWLIFGALTIGWVWYMKKKQTQS